MSAAFSRQNSSATNASWDKANRWNTVGLEHIWMTYAYCSTFYLYYVPTSFRTFSANQCQKTTENKFHSYLLVLLASPFFHYTSVQLLHLSM
jgi:hypothetical protein